MVDNDEEQFFMYLLIYGVGVFGVDNNVSMLVLIGVVDYERQLMYIVCFMFIDSGVL